ncbi:glycosyl hydrolases family 18-domain-containing protein [Stachybotrys elegans]|uniref:chitinase n=1 Tax=Stachybotrys elegans TaxID=80388 RepID=A0A8K0SHA0_9HYPO|nr:glycosyl hydrolases family 18-domain-containing protein [Stachybotrys elegans]
MLYVNWVNLMSYDLHGSWDTEESYVGNIVSSHTNLTEIQDALELLWRNNVPAYQVNLGIEFYGRSFELADSKGNRPGCRQNGPADQGPCTGQAGVLSYEEVEQLVKRYHLNVVYDEEAGVKYLSWSKDQWIAYNDKETLQQKVKYANERGLGDLMIWAIDLDDKENSALDALLQPDGLGKHDIDCPKKGERRHICCDRRYMSDESQSSLGRGESQYVRRRKIFLGVYRSYWKEEYQPVSCPNETPKDACYFPGNKLEIETKNVPVRLDWLFPGDTSESDEEVFNLQVKAEEGASTDADNNAFGFVIMSGPKKDLISLDKRDGSHWELFDCANHDSRQTIRAVCMDTGPEGNCGDIYIGQVAETVVELPPGCGAGRYAVAVKLEPSENQTMPAHIESKVSRRRSFAPRMYDFTFDYDFSPIHARDKSDVRVRIDFASEPGYWGEVVNKAPGRRKRSLGEMHEIVKRDHEGSWPSYLHEVFRIKKRETPKHQLDDFHKRWFSSDLGDWIDKIREVDLNYDIVYHRVHEHHEWDIFDESIQCVNYRRVPGVLMYASRASMKSWIELDVDIEVVATLSLIGDLATPKTWDQKGLLFRTKGSMRSKLAMVANAELILTTDPFELFGAENFGLTSSVPGIVTIGPNLRIIGSIDGIATLNMAPVIRL